MRSSRSRALLAIGVVLVIAAGLALRQIDGVRDALWAAMVFLGWAFVVPRASTYGLAALALGTSYAVELSQLYQAPWINGLRESTLGHLVLGSAFSWSDMLAYTAGVAAIAAAEVAFTFLSSRWSRAGRSPA